MKKRTDSIALNLLGRSTSLYEFRNQGQLTVKGS